MKQSLTKEKKIIIITQSIIQKKKKMEGYLYFYFIKMIFAFLNKHEACLSTLVTISCNFQICKYIIYDQITTPLLL